MPLAAKLLPLIDYEQEREHAAATNKLVMLDYYSFDVEVRKGVMTFRDMFWMLSKVLGLKVQAMTHPVSEETGIKEQQWTVRIHASACPAALRQLGFLQIEDVEVVIHHSAIHVNWPCKRCHSPDHPTRFCKILLDELEGEKKKHTNRYEGTKPSTKGVSSREYAAGSQPRTMEQLETMLRTEGSKLDGRAAGRNSWAAAEKRPTSPTRRTADSTKEKLRLPEEWGQSLQPSNAEEPAEDHIFEVFDEVLECKRQQEVPTVAESTLKTDEHELQEKNSLEDDGGSDVDVEMATATEKSRIAVEHATATKWTKQKQKQERVKQKTDVRGRSPTRRQGRTLRERKRAQEEVRQKSKDIQERMEKEGCQLGGAKASNMTAKEREDDFAVKTRKTSLSPKRKAEDLDTGHDGDDADDQGDSGRQGAVSSPGDRSVSPKRRSTNAARSGDKVIMQSFIHQYMKATTIKSADDGEVRTGSGVDRASRAPMPTKSAPINYHSNREHEYKSGPDKEHTEADCSVVAVTKATDTGAPLSTWMAILGGTVVDVAANGNCGWLAFYASLYNEAEGVQIPTPEVTDKVNQLKKMVLNEMTANLSEEMKLHPEELEVELRASGCHAAVQGEQVQQLCALANHLATQRDKTVKAQVPLHFWVRPSHLKALAMHARETIYALYVYNDQARIQAYAYHEVETGTGDMMEIGTVCPIPTQQAMDLLADLIAADIRPPVMVLRWRSSGNHFQAVQYQPDAHANYDEVMTAKAAAKSLANIRKGARVRQEEKNKQRIQDGEEVLRVTDKSKTRSADEQLEKEGVEGDADTWDPEQTTREGFATGFSKPEVDRKSSLTRTLEVMNTSDVMVKEDAALSRRGSEQVSLNGKSDEANKSADVDTSELDSMVAGVAQTQ
ncbi:unnamed protein product [Phytophthora fragariaefolia]|uniref:Unnamed protein product n=1 Tax=Phytophthora fragariaefolia TaxID=1490495 RepID=A0A9W6XAG8_9STRA|nr:unnamed protein product [Phytophthora fragariaefolia]